MCAIAGVVGANDPSALARVEEMLRIQRHRGPDGSGVLSDVGIVMGHCRLAILGLGYAGRQPMTSRDGRWSMVFNGEIFNYLELRGDLPGEFHSGTDTEVLLEGIAVWGVSKNAGAGGWECLLSACGITASGSSRWRVTDWERNRWFTLATVAPWRLPAR